MRVPPFERYRGFTRAAGCFLLGAVAGAAVLLSISHDHLNALHLTIDKLNTVIEEKNHDITQLTEYKNEHNNVIKTVHVYVENNRLKNSSSSLDLRTELELKKAVKKDFDIFLGRKVYEIGDDSRLARTLLDNKVYTLGIDSKKYQIQVKTMLIVDTSLTVWVTAKMQPVL
ncbi:hypothetical protein ACFOQM_12185 [Paenibacillus sp. GCM10012307]|uniref:Sporulation membrane protein YtrI C-terminal domain-containing protein n=1 Tax=Paenibacillus roseus TaxID=2798579 RepID=A0A934MR67_9BACL|nr:hypothetical protein [Paenibacillus roseus]MBJ6362049.1 hypothetical protein [Paenibacillus roseus]